MNLVTGGWASPLLQLVARLRSEGINSTTPVTEINGGTISATNADIALVAKGTGATLAQVPTSTTAGGNKRGTYATDFQKSRSNSSMVASGNYSIILGGNDNTAAGDYAVLCGGSSNSVSGSNSFVGSGSSVSTSGSFATAVGGNNCFASSYGFTGGGQNNSVSGSHAVVAGGLNCSATNTYATNLGGRENVSNGICSSVLGGSFSTTRGITGYSVIPACYQPIAQTNGCTQSATLLLARQTTNATPIVLASDSSTADSTNQVILPNNAAYSFSGEVIAGVTGGGNTARWTISGAIKRGANAASTAMVGTPTVTMTHNDAGAAAWTVAVTADTTNGGIAVTVTGAAATTIRWVCRINTTEMTF